MMCYGWPRRSSCPRAPVALAQSAGDRAGSLLCLLGREEIRICRAGEERAVVASHVRDGELNSAIRGGNVAVVVRETVDVGDPTFLGSKRREILVARLAVLTESGQILEFAVHESAAADAQQQTSLNIRLKSVYNPKVAILAMVLIEGNLLASTATGKLEFLSFQEGGLRLECDIKLHSECTDSKDSEDLQAIHHFSWSSHSCILAGITATGDCQILKFSEAEMKLLHGFQRGSTVSPSSSDILTIHPESALECNHMATCCDISGGYLAVGLSDGSVEIYWKPNPNTSYSARLLRTFNLDEWGYDTEGTGAVTCLRWIRNSTHAKQARNLKGGALMTSERVFAVGYRRGIVVVWSVSGCRLGFFSVSGQEQIAAAVADMCWLEDGLRLLVVVQVGTSEDNPLMGEAMDGDRMLEFTFARSGKPLEYISSMEYSRKQELIDPEESSVNVLLGTDRLILLGKGLVPRREYRDEAELLHIVVPSSYLRPNWPLSKFALTSDGNDIAVAGEKGLALYNVKARRWRMFGDIVEENALEVEFLTWMDKIICVCVRSKGRNMVVPNHHFVATTFSDVHRSELLFYPRYHLSNSSLLHRQTLAEVPVSVHSLHNYLLVASGQLEISIYLVILSGNSISRNGAPSLTLEMIQTCSLPTGPDLCGVVDILLIPPRTCCQTKSSPKPTAPSAPIEKKKSSGWFWKLGEEITGMMTATRAPSISYSDITEILVLRSNGDLSVVDVVDGVERALASGVHRAWIPREEYLGHSSLGRSIGTLHKKSIDIEAPLWFYTSAGIKSLYLSKQKDVDDEIDLEFDMEVYPTGVCESGTIFGFGQYLSYTSASSLPLVCPQPRTQPMLPTLLLGLLKNGKFGEASWLAWHWQNSSSFVHIIELMLYTSLESELIVQIKAGRNKSQLRRHDSDELVGNIGGSPRVYNEGPRSPDIISRASNIPIGQDELTNSAINDLLSMSLLEATSLLTEPLNGYLAAVAGVARKTDPRYWSKLFNTVGNPLSLYRECMHREDFYTASQFIRVIEELSGSDIAQERAIALLQQILRHSLYELAGDVVRYLVRCGYDSSCLVVEEHEKERFNKSEKVDKAAASMLKWLFSRLDTQNVNTKSGALPVPEQLRNTLGRILYQHASLLLAGLEMRRLVAMSRCTTLDLRRFIEADGKPRGYVRAIFHVDEKLLQHPELQDELEFAFSSDFPCSPAWALIFGTVLKRPHIIFDAISSDPSLWKSYSDAVKGAMDGKFALIVEEVEVVLKEEAIVV